MTNKRIGDQFEIETLERLACNGYWVHFITPDIRGAQPFDIIAVKDGIAHAVDCKTCVASSFNISRLEENQIMAFEKWLKCGNSMPIVTVKHDDKVYDIPYNDLKIKKSINLKKEGEKYESRGVLLEYR